MRPLIFAAFLGLPGCMSLGVQQMTPEQIRATEGLATCTTLYTAWGKGATASVNVDDVRKGATQKGKITITPECAVTIETDVGVSPPKFPEPKLPPLPDLQWSVPPKP